MDAGSIAGKDDLKLFCHKLPKIELHAHLTGSIGAKTLHEIWQEMQAEGVALDIDNPIEVLETARKGMDVNTFFPLFSKYIYRLCNTKRHIIRATLAVLSDFHADGVTYLELRTIPRAASDLTKDEYVATVLETIAGAAPSAARPEQTYLILGVDRKNTASEALETVELAIRYRRQGIVGVDLCGNPSKGDVMVFGPAFARAKEVGLKITLHFAETAASSMDEELRALLGYEPDRLGHVINVPPWAKEEIERKRMGLELCLTCNVDAKLIKGGFAEHHFGFWWGRGVPIAICTDDVGIFGSNVSNEYYMLMKHFRLSKAETLEVGRSAIECIFGTEGDKRALREQMDSFARENAV